MQTPLLPGETLVKEGGANHQRGAENVGGRLFLTSARLIFESHALNVQTGTFVAPRADITSAKPCWTKFLGAIPLAPNSIEVSLRDGQKHNFVVMGRAAWLRVLEEKKPENQKRCHSELARNLYSSRPESD